MIMDLRQSVAQGENKAAEGLTLWITEIMTPLGVFRACIDNTAVRSLRFIEEGERKGAEFADNFAGAAGGNALAAKLREELEAYFCGKSAVFTVPVRTDLYTSFDRKAWAALRRIPCGETRSYGEQADMMGLPCSYARAVAAADGRNPLPLLLPCHRVIAANGGWSGYNGGVWRKRALLAHERRYFS